MKQSRVHAIVLLAILGVISLIVFNMTRQFLMVIFLAALTSAMVQPIFNWFLSKTKEKRSISATLTLLTVILGVLLPLSGVVGMFVGQAIQISEKIQPRIQKELVKETTVEQFILTLPSGEHLVKYQDQILEKGGEVIKTISVFFVNKLSNATLTAMRSLLLFFLYLYTLFFFIMDGKKILQRILYLLPLPSHQEDRLLERFTSVTRATLKGTLLIGIIQGALAGIALALAGVDSALFWSMLMMILSVIPVVGTVLVWLPAALILIVSGSVVSGVLVLLWCGLVVGNIDNLLRPKLVGQEAGLHELLILFTTLGGLSLFGISGFIVGPIIAALWVTLWDMYGEMFDHLLPPVIEKINLSDEKDELKEIELEPILPEEVEKIEKEISDNLK